MRPTQFRTKAAAKEVALQLRINLKCNAHKKPSCTLKCMQEKIHQYLEERRRIQKKSGFLTVNGDIHFLGLCQGNRDFKGELQGKTDVSLYFWPVIAMSIFDYRFN